MRKLPPFAALRAFEAVARRRSLKDASDELSISPSAVSHQVRALEVFLATKLFIRGATGMVPTSEGERLFRDIAEALDKIEASTLSIARDRDKAILTVHLYHSLAQLWLIPLLGDFLGSNPGISVKCVTKPDEVDFAGTPLDMAIRYALEPPSEPLAIKLIDEVVFPVVSPDYLRASDPIETPQDILGKRLIACEREMGEWRFWFAAVGLNGDSAVPQLVFDTRNQALQAAAEGLGIALNRRPSGDLMIQRGALIAPLPGAVETRGAYYAVAPERSASLVRVRRFSAWLASSCAHWRRDDQDG
jgi:LysR family transcriptional regulator, glycine cleavage system transcriptional activator